jgi:hypothetical protein
MLFFRRKAEYRPAIADGQSLTRSVLEVPAIVAALANSFKHADGKPAVLENTWLYTGSSERTLDRVWFGSTIGLSGNFEDLLDRVINIVDQTNVSLGVNPKSGDIGVHIIASPHNIDHEKQNATQGIFVPDRKHLLRDRPLASYLHPDVRGPLIARYSGSNQNISNRQLAEFVLTHHQREESVCAIGDSDESAAIAYIPRSMTVNLFATAGSYNPTRAFFEPPIRSNRFESGELIADGHIHRALTPRRNANDSWLHTLAKRYGHIRIAATLSPFDCQTLMSREHLGKHFGVPSFQDAARELFVIDDDGRIVGHSVFNLVSLYADNRQFERFVQVTRQTLKDSTNAELRLLFHDMMIEFTTQKGIDEQLLESDYS